ADGRAFEETVGLLYRYSLVRRSEGRLSMHRLVQDVVRLSMPQEAGQQRVRTCLRLLDDVFPEQGSDIEVNPLAAELLPHALTATQHATVADNEPEAAHRLLLRVGAYMGRQAQLTGAQTSLEHAHAIAIAAYGRNNP